MSSSHFIYVIIYISQCGLVYSFCTLGCNPVHVILFIAQIVPALAIGCLQVGFCVHETPHPLFVNTAFLSGATW